MFAHVAQGIGYGFAGAAQPGPFQTFLVSQTLKNGWRRTMPCALAPLITDGPIIVLVLVVLSRVPPSMQRWLHLLSGLFILYLAWKAYTHWRKAKAATGTARESPVQSLLKAVVMNFISPGPYIFWSLVAGPALLEGWRELPVIGVAFLVSFYFSLLGTFAATVLIFGTAAHLGPRVNRVMSGACALALAGFGIYQLWLAASAG